MCVQTLSTKGLQHRSGSRQTMSCPKIASQIRIINIFFVLTDISHRDIASKQKADWLIQSAFSFIIYFARTAVFLDCEDW